jgi:DNA modification methylase
MNQLIRGDNLAILKQLDANSMDLIYLDPPFFSNRNYEVIWGDAGEICSFQDRWSGGIEHYLAWLKERVEEMHRILKPTGSLFLHCDWHATSYIQVFILDKVFGNNCYLNTIAWSYDTGATPKGKKLLRKHDSIYWYAKEVSNLLVYNLNYKHFIPSDDLKRYKMDEDGRLWRDNPVGNYSEENIRRMDSEGKIFYTKNGKPRIKMYLENESGKYFKYKKLSDFWTDIDALNANSSERIGYPTQKPEALLERIINMASNEGDLVLDPFVGGGTTVVVADRLKRQWLGIDQSVQAIKVSERRLRKQQSVFTTRQRNS